MLRSFIAVIVAVVAGLTTAKFAEGAGAGLLNSAPPSGAYQIILLISWFAGAFIAGCVALIIARRWAPVGIIASASIFISAVAAMLASPMNWLVWCGAVAVTFAGSYISILITHARFSFPDKPAKTGLFE
ncbi:hypothetical protein [Hyphococcus sp.]|uniref:hypothetical protein n=1 Tax=Hyphococcus sp. TaxID=2038636 RepID=UPI003CCBA805